MTMTRSTMLALADELWASLPLPVEDREIVLQLVEQIAGFVSELDDLPLDSVDAVPVAPGESD